jgi:hypothetical protein
MFESISRSINIVKKSFGVLMEEKQLLLFPVVSTVAVVALFISYLAPAVIIKNQLLTALLFFAFYFLSYFFVIFFNSALIHAANEKLEGRKPALMGSISFALSKIGNIVLWAGISATVGLIMYIIRSIASRQKGIGGLIAGLAASVVGMAWSFATYFVVPVMIFENVSPFTAIKRSIEIVKKTWSEQILGSFAIGIVFFVFYLIGVICVIAGFVITPLMILLVPLGIMIMLLVFILQGAMQGIFLAELYRYSMTGQATLFKDEIEQVKGKPPTQPSPPAQQTVQ